MSRVETGSAAGSSAGVGLMAHEVPLDVSGPVAAKLSGWHVPLTASSPYGWLLLAVAWFTLFNVVLAVVRVLPHPAGGKTYHGRHRRRTYHGKHRK